MRNILRSSILVVSGVLALAQAGDHVTGNAHDKRGLSDTLAGLGLSGADIAAVEQAAAKHHEAAANDYPKEPEMGSERGHTARIETKHTVTVVHTVPGETKTIHTSIQKEVQEITKTVQMTVTVDGPPAIIEAGTCAVVSEHITSTVVEHLTVTMAAPPVAPITQTVVHVQPAPTSTVHVTHTVTTSPPQVVVTSEAVKDIPAVTNAPQAPEAPPSVVVVSSPAAAPSHVASSLVVGGAGQIASGTGTLMADGACDCMCLCSTGSFPTIAAMPQPPAQPATTLATSIASQPTSIASGLLVDTSSPPPAIVPSAVDTSTVAAPNSSPSPALSSETPSTTPETSLSSPAIETSSPTASQAPESSLVPESSPTPEPSPSLTQSSTTATTETTSSTSSLATPESAGLPSPLAATQAFSLQLTIAEGIQPTNAPTAVIAPIDIKTFGLTDALILGSLAKPTPK